MCFDAIASAASSRSKDPEVRTTGSATGTQTRGSSPRPQPKPSPISRTVSNVSRSFVNDVAMGLSTFGQSGERQAQTLRERGYSDDVISDYQARTATSAARRSERLESRGSGGDDDNRPAPARVLAPARSAPATTTPTPIPPSAPSADAEPGSAEEAVVEGAKTRKGRASTIATAPTGLLTTARTRRRRSLMGGEEPMGLIE